jgi:hypothetical protein
MADLLVGDTYIDVKTVTTVRSGLREPRPGPVEVEVVGDDGRMAAPSLTAIVARLAALEARLADIEGPYAEAQYRTRRDVTGMRITLNRMAAQAGVSTATEEEIDAALDDEA